MNKILIAALLVSFNAFAYDSTNQVSRVSVAASADVSSDVFVMNVGNVPKLYAGKTCVMSVTPQNHHKIDDPILVAGSHPNPAIRAASLANYDRYKTVRGYQWTFAFSPDGRSATITSNGGEYPTSLTYIEGTYYTSVFTHQNSVELSSDVVVSGVTYKGIPRLADVFDFHPTYGNVNTLFGACT